MGLFKAERFVVVALLVAVQFGWSESGCSSIVVASFTSTTDRVLTLEEVKNCPDKCRCITSTTTSLVSVDCSSAHLPSVPKDLPADTVELSLDDNGIITLENASFRGCSKLRKLSVARNQLSTIERKALSATMGNLEELYLNDNSLSLNDSYFEIFSELRNIVVLSLHNNAEVLDAIFTNLTNLKTLTIDRSEILEFGSELRGLINLSSLALYGKIVVIQNNSFENLSHSSIKELTVKSQNTLSEIQALAFGSLISLETLDLSYNRGIGFENVSNAWYGLQFTKIKTLNLARIISDDNVGPPLTKQFYTNLDQCPYIEKLILSRNNIVSVDDGLAKAFPNLEHIEFSYNRLSNVATLILEMAFMPKLSFLDFSYQTKRYLNKRSLTASEPSNHTRDRFNFKSPPSTIAAGAAFSSECRAAIWKPCPIFSDHRPTAPKLSENLRKDIPLPDFGPWCILFPRQLNILNLSATLNVQLNNMPQIIVLGDNYQKGRVKHLVYRGNGLTSFTGPLVFGPNATWSLDFSDNGATCLAPDMLKLWIQLGGRAVKFLFENNDIGQQLEHDEYGTTFQYHSRLSELNLARNNIKALPYKIFFNLTELEKLNLSGNSLRLIQFKIDHFEKLQVLDLSNNLITNLAGDILTNIKQLFISSNMNIDLTGNPIQCACETLYFLDWMHENQANLNKIEKISCLMNGTLISFDRLSEILLRLHFECATNMLAIACATILGVVLLAMAVSVFLYRHRWDISYFFLDLKKKRNQHQERSTHYTYDAFVSYDHKDSKWVRNELMKNLESTVELRNVASAEEGVSQEARSLNGALRLCIHKRDFQDIGSEVKQNILTAIQQSRKVIIVLSNNFLSSHWCKFELEMSRMESLERGYNFLVPIMLTSLELADMPSCVQWLVRKNTYIRWNEDECPDSEVFWAKLRRVLNGSGLEPWICECGKTIFEEKNTQCSEEMQLGT